MAQGLANITDLQSLRRLFGLSNTAPQVPTLEGMPQVDTSPKGLLMGALAGLTSLQPAGAAANMLQMLAPPANPYIPQNPRLREQMQRMGLQVGEPVEMMLGEVPKGARSLVKPFTIEELPNPRYQQLERRMAKVEQLRQATYKREEELNAAIPRNQTTQQFNDYYEKLLPINLELGKSYRVGSKIVNKLSQTPTKLKQQVPTNEAPTYFSNLAEAFSNPKIPNKLSPEQALAVIEKTPGVKAEEAKWVFNGDAKGFLRQKPRWTKEELLDHIRGHEIDVVEVPSRVDPATMKNTTMPSRDAEPIFYAWLDQNFTPAHVTEHDIYGRSYFPTREMALRGEQEDAGRYLGQGDPTNINTTWISKYRQNYQVQGSKLIDLYNDSLGGKGSPITPIQNEGLFDPKWGPSGEYNQPLTLPNPQNYRERLLVWGNKREPQPLQYDAPNYATYAAAQGYTPEQITATWQTNDPMFQNWRVYTDANWDASINSKAQPFHSGHFDPENILAHIRTTDRTTPDGKRILFIEEAQSDWQKALRQMDKANADPRNTWDFKASKILHEKGLGEYAPLEKEDFDLLTQPGDLESRQELLRSTRGEFKGNTPNAPLARDYPSLVMKRILRLASEEGYDGVGWTTGKQQADRYNRMLMEGVNRVDYDLAKQQLTLTANNGTTKTVNATVRDLPGMVGAEAAEKLLQNAGSEIIQVPRPTGGLINFVATPIRTREGTELWQWTGRNSGDPYSPMYSSYDELIQHPVTQENFRRARLNVHLETPLAFEEGGAVLPNGHYVTGYDNPITALQQYINTTTTKSSITAPDLLVGERGYADVYDRQLGTEADKIGKRFGSKTTKGSIGTGTDYKNYSPTLEEMQAARSPLSRYFLTDRERWILTQMNEIAPMETNGSTNWQEGLHRMYTDRDLMRQMQDRGQEPITASEYSRLQSLTNEAIRAVREGKKAATFADAHIHLLTPTLRTHATTKGFPLFQVVPPLVLGAGAATDYANRKRRNVGQ